MKKISTFIDSRGEMKFLNSQEFLSINKKNVVRGIHCSPYSKIVTCLSGSLIDFVIDLKTYKYQEFLMKENDSLVVPENMGHCFLSLEDNTQVLYHLNGIYDDKKEINIRYDDPFINLPLTETDYIVSEKDRKSPFVKPLTHAIIGASGFLGTHLRSIFPNAMILKCRLESPVDIEETLEKYKPKYLINAAGISGKPTVKWCEENKEETYRVNYLYQICVMDICKRLGIHLTICGSGLIFKGDKTYTEEDEGNLTDLYYSYVRIFLEKEVKKYNNILYLRILYPISGDGNPKCFYTKLLMRTNSIHKKRVNITTIPLFELLPKMLENNEVGIFNFVNKNTIFLHEILDMEKVNYKLVICEANSDPILDTTKLESKYPVEDVKKSVFKVVHNEIK